MYGAKGWHFQAKQKGHKKLFDFLQKAKPKLFTSTVVSEAQEKIPCLS